jgi:hypothetical protein
VAGSIMGSLGFISFVAIAAVPLVLCSFTSRSRSLSPCFYPLAGAYSVGVSSSS